mgnify:CR=1 FL=1
MKRSCREKALTLKTVMNCKYERQIITARNTSCIVMTINITSLLKIPLTITGTIHILSKLKHVWSTLSVHWLDYNICLSGIHYVSKEQLRFPSYNHPDIFFLRLDSFIITFDICIFLVYISSLPDVTTIAKRTVYFAK